MKKLTRIWNKSRRDGDDDDKFSLPTRDDFRPIDSHAFLIFSIYQQALSPWELVAEVQMGRYMASIWPSQWGGTLPICRPFTEGVIRRSKKTSRLHVCFQGQLRSALPYCSDNG
ncbi:hypothetical protein RJ639_042405 [Escallonia herrerae]|uniref:Uncharacterized protein n=1 Tax=Escallonia herrerae TaxID=1293975 RepID=A0AA88WFW6_9ASTE|nr:hypothetical protein RJ639_042405 [Escallonia herrerae]